MSPMPACTVIRSFEIRCGAGELLPILPTKICVVQKTRGESGPLCRHHKKDRHRFLTSRSMWRAPIPSSAWTLVAVALELSRAVSLRVLDEALYPTVVDGVGAAGRAVHPETERGPWLLGSRPAAMGLRHQLRVSIRQGCMR